VRTKSLKLNKVFRKIFKLQKHNIVALLLPNLPEYPVCAFGTFLAGLKLTTLNPLYTSGKLKMTSKFCAQGNIFLKLKNMFKNLFQDISLKNSCT